MRVLFLIFAVVAICTAQDVSETPDETCSQNEVSETPAETCSENEVSTECSTTCQDKFCANSENQDTSSLNQICEGNSCCICRFDYRRAANGTCIPTTSCPPFECKGEHKAYNACPLYCPTDSCTYVNSGGKCPSLGRIGILLICNPKCTCAQGYWRKDGVCVEPEQCPNYIPPTTST